MAKWFGVLIFCAAAVTLVLYMDLPLFRLKPGKLACDVLQQGDSYPRSTERSFSHLPYYTCPNVTRPPSAVFKEPPRTNDTGLKKILFWNYRDKIKHYTFGFGRLPFLVAGCRVNTCTTTADRTRYPIEEVDALFWHVRSQNKALPKKRSPQTRYVFWSGESPSYQSTDLKKYNNTFNWTFTYRLDSDIPHPYDVVFRRQEPLPPTNRNYAKGKTKMAAWFVSHCSTESGREKLIRQLKKRIKVDVFGKCGFLSCPTRNNIACYQMLSNQYKFYFSFENSLCTDYITEKFFNILRWDVVPVVFGLGSYLVQGPPHSYIDALSFPSVDALADYLLYLDCNDTAYNEYFKWKRFYEQCDSWTLTAQHFCKLCEMLHSDAPAKTYDMYQWYEKGHCKTKESPDIARFISGLKPHHEGSST